ncbi:hypothetical protein GCM10010177_59690 [Actinomadura citrea]|nr:hypothetical protein GCM10010177_59690 [Actinomadura citrea]
MSTGGGGKAAAGKAAGGRSLGGLWRSEQGIFAVSGVEAAYVLLFLFPAGLPGVTARDPGAHLGRLRVPQPLSPSRGAGAAEERRGAAGAFAGRIPVDSR